MSKMPRINLTCESEAQYETWVAAAAVDKRKLPDWMRIKLDEAAEQALSQQDSKKRK